MLQTLNRSWALLLGVMLLMIGNGIQGTLLGIRGAIEGFSTFELSLVMSAYFAGFLGGSHYTPLLIRRVGHVRVFAALGSLVSAILILFPTLTEPWAWVAMRVLMGFCFSGIYVTAESWLNNAATNATRGAVLSLYMVVQMLGIIGAQALISVGDPTGFVLFIIPSVLVSLAFAPILLSVSPAPNFETAKPMGIWTLFRIAPLSCVGAFLLGGVYSALFGMASVYGGEAGLSVEQISIFVASIYVGGLLLQFPIGYGSDRMDRRWLIIIVALGCAGGAALGLSSDSFPVLVAAGFLIGGMANPLYGLTAAYANDYLELDDMAAASGRLVFLNGLGAMGGPPLTGWLMGVYGPGGFFLFIAGLMVMLVSYGVYRSFKRPAPSADETGAYVPVTLSSSAVALGAAQDVYAEAKGDDGTDGPMLGEGEEEDVEEIPTLPTKGAA